MVLVKLSCFWHTILLPEVTIAQVKFDLDTLETFGTTIGTAFEYQDYGNGWYRLQINASVSLGAAFRNFKGCRVR